MDASLKESEYDVVLVGTGMVEGILAGWTKNENIAPRNFGDEEENDQVASKTGKIAAVDGGTQQVLPMKSSFECRLLEEGFADEATKESLLRQSSSFSIDVNPRLMLSSEQLVEILISSGVGRYLEFAAIERTYVHFQPAVSGAKTAEGAESDTVWEVPCSKKDVFQSKLLGIVEKRQLMKFLQFVADYGETHILHEDVKTKNERTLALGRALKRPQNKASQADGDAELEKYLDRPFQELLEKHFKLSSKLQQVVVYCVGLASFPATKNQISAREGLEAVYRYVASIGRFTGTAFLAPLYGISELAQSFCRLSAVYGGIYVLRAPIDGFVLDTQTNELCGVHCTDGDVLRTKHVVTNGSYIDNLRLSNGEQPNHAHGQILRGVYVLKLSLREGMSRLMLVIPPEDSEFQNPFAIQVIQLDVGAYACPKGYFLVQISMPLPTEWFGQSDKQQNLVQTVIRRLILSSEMELQHKHGKKSAAEVASTPNGSTDENAVETKADTATDSATTTEADTPSTQLILSDRIAWRAIFTMDHLASGDAKLINTSTKATDLPANAWVCETPMTEFDHVVDAVEPQKPTCNAASPLEIHLESASANARAIFEALSPGEPFLPKSASAEQAEQEEQESEEDAVLRAAQKLAQQTELAGKQEQSGGAEHKGDATTAQTEANVVNETSATQERDGATSSVEPQV
ncbi:unnamed protein product [Phytophthora fragariaefolia]|uniref:Unnamed protein product n=1 Tax=Phytophthora fragariaefolia TaxID=1490495 RepID=A0A9W6YE07_9STRA|nr:unnamed protein product [Phytophthora fragariaefolia]